MADIFISHANEDADVAKDICAALEASGVTCWIAPRDIVAGADYRSEILRGVGESAALLLLYSPAASRSEHVAREVSLADEGDKPIFPLRIDTHELEGPLRYVLQGKQWVDFRADPAAAVSSVVQAMKGSAPERAPKIKRRGVSPLMLGLAALALLAIGVGGFFGYRSWQTSQIIAACHREAGSELEIGANAGAGVVFGMIRPGPALAACTQAVNARPSDARLRFNLFRALAAATPTERTGLPRRVRVALDAAAQTGHVEAVALLAGYSESDSDDAIAPPAAEIMTAAIGRLVPLALANDPRAQYVLAHMPMPMCQAVSEGHAAPQPGAAEGQIFAWMKAEYARGHPDQAPAAAAALAQASNPAAADAQVGDAFCELGKRYLLAHASANGLAAAQLELAHGVLSQTFAPESFAWIEPRPADEVLAAAVAQNYAPALYFDIQRSVSCRAEDGAPQRASDSAWARLERLAESGYRPAMSEAATLILLGCAPQNNKYPAARAWLDRASAGMELDQ